MRTSPYQATDHALLDQARAAGCVLPAFTPIGDPAAWRAWSAAVAKPIALSRDPFALAFSVIKARIAADALAGRPMDVPMFAVPADAFALTAAAFAEVG